MKGILIQVIATLIICTGHYFVGYSVAWPSFALITLESPNTPLDSVATKFDANLIGSLPMLGSFASTLYAGVLNDMLGRKKTLLLTAICYVLSWTVVTTAKGVTLVIIARFTLGLANGMHMVAGMPLISELCQFSIRATMVSLTTAAYCLGTLTSYLTGWFLSYEVVNYLNMTHAVLFVLMTVWLKESPAFLISQGREEEAIKSIQFYRGVSKPTQNVIDEINYLKDLQGNSKKLPNKDCETIYTEVEKEKLRPEDTIEQQEVGALKFLWTSTPNRRALIIATAHILLLVFGGTLAIAVYAGQLFTTAAPGISPHLCAVILAVAFAVGAFCGMAVSDALNRRLVMISSCLVSGICLALLWSLLRWSWAPQWAIPATVIVYCCVFQLGMGNVPILQISEIFPSKLKSITIVIALSFMCIGNFTILATFAPTVEFLGLANTFLMFSGVCFLASVFSFFFMKETKGVPIEAIQMMYEEGFLYRRNFVYEKVSVVENKVVE